MVSEITVEILSLSRRTGAGSDFRVHRAMKDRGRWTEDSYAKAHD